MNVLLTCAGRRNYLVQYFKEALAGKGLVHAADASGFAPAMQEADATLSVPNVDHPDYIDTLLNYCRKNDISLLISLNDLELPVLAHHRDSFISAGIIPVVSSEETTDICFDKWKTVLFAREAGIATPETYLRLSETLGALNDGVITYPVVVKPRWGSASIGIEYAYSEEELVSVFHLAHMRIKRTMLAKQSEMDEEQCILIQQCLKGQEYGLDVVNDLSGKNVAVFAKKKLAMRAGETDRAETVNNETLEAIGAVIGRKLGHIGNLDVDVFYDGEEYYLLELNPRFGGGYPFSQVAGADIPSALIAWAEGKGANSKWLKVSEGVASSKCDRLVLVKKENYE